jgi:hypothetical protein
MIVVDVREKVLKLKVSTTSDYTFDLQKPFNSRSKGIEVLKDLYLQSVQSRIQALERDEFQIVSDLSGGFDSRALLGGIEKFTHDVIYCTQKLDTNDQREWGQAIFEAMGSPGKFYTAAPDFSYEIDKLGNFVYQYDCMSNFSIGFNSSQVVIALKELVPEKAVRCMGFGASDFLRKPIKAFRKSLIYGIDHGFYFYSNISLSDVCHFVGVSYHDYHQELEEYLQNYPEKTSDGQLRRMYFEYHNQYINAHEDYCRKYFWTVCPFWGTMFVRAIVERIPLEWTGFRYFTQFMKSLDPRLLQTPIFGKSVNLNSERSVSMLETKEQVRIWLTAFIPSAHFLYKFIQARINDYDTWKEIEPIIKDISCPLIQSTLPNSQLKLIKGNVLVSRRYLTLLLYLYEIEKRYGEKI